jgi:hypothetical protein
MASIKMVTGLVAGFAQTKLCIEDAHNHASRARSKGPGASFHFVTRVSGTETRDIE